MQNKRTKSLISEGCSNILLAVSFRPLLEEYWLPPEVHFPPAEESNLGGDQNTTGPLIGSGVQWSVSPTTAATHGAIILNGVVPRTVGEPVGLVQSWIPISIRQRRLRVT